MAVVGMTTQTRQGAVNDVLVDPHWLQEHLHDPGLRLVEVDVSPVAYDEGHLEGAVLWNVYRDLKDGNYQLVDKASVEALISRSGIDANTTIVFYGYAPALGLWLMKLYGHPDARILDCSRETWQARGGPWTQDVVTPRTTRYPLPDPDNQIRATQSTMLAGIDDPTCAIVDVRSGPEFRGERFWPSGGLEPGGRAGHVPTARNLPIDGLRDDEGSFRGTQEVRRVFDAITPGKPGDVILYCTIGARASTAWFALTYLLGLPDVRVYDGSWAEWGRMPSVPVEGS